MSFHPERPISTDRPRQKNESTRFDFAKNPNNYWRSRCEQFPDAGSFNPQPTRSNRDNRKSFRSFTLLPSFPPPRIIPAKFPFGRENLIIDVILVTTTTPPPGGSVPDKQKPTENKPVSGLPGEITQSGHPLFESTYFHPEDGR